MSGRSISNRCQKYHKDDLKLFATTLASGMIKISNYVVKNLSPIPGTVATCCMPSGEVGVVWVKTSLSLGQGHTWT